MVGLTWTGGGEFPTLHSTDNFCNVSRTPAVWEVNVRTSVEETPGRLFAYYIELDGPDGE